MKMNYTTTMRFIELMRGMPGLWDRNHRDYLNKDVRNQLKVHLSKMVGLFRSANVRTRRPVEDFEVLSKFWPDEPIPRKRPLEFESAFSVSYSEDGTSNSEQQEAGADEHTDKSCKRFVLKDPDFVDDNYNDVGDVASTSPPLKRIKSEFPPEPRLSDCLSPLAVFGGTSMNGAPARAVPLTLNPPAPHPSMHVEDEDVLFGRYNSRNSSLSRASGSSS